MIAVAYAARHSARVRRLVFFGGVANGVTYGEMGEQAGLRSLMVHDYDVYADMWARAASGFDDELGPALVRWGKATPFAVVDAYWSAVTSIDTTPMLEAIDRPALMVYRRHALDAAWFALLSAMAARVAHAKLVKLDGSGMLPVAGDTEPLAAAIDEFLGARAAAP
jgi:pimeloyl-ACP methyl ester carboxylesterase